MSTVHTHPESMSEEAYREFALSELDGQWELVRGQLWERPGMSITHTRVTMTLAALLLRQLDWNQFRVSSSLSRMRVSADTYYVPDVAVIPTDMMRRLGENPRTLDAYAEPLPLVAEVWFPSTGKRDIEVKLPDYQRRGDAEIWFIHPFARTLTAWRHLPDGSYAETVYHEGIARPASLPDVAIALDALFAA